MKRCKDCTCFGKKLDTCFTHLLACGTAETCVRYMETKMKDDFIEERKKLLARMEEMFRRQIKPKPQLPIIKLTRIEPEYPKMTHKTQMKIDLMCNRYMRIPDMPRPQCVIDRIGQEVESIVERDCNE